MIDNYNIDFDYLEYLKKIKSSKEFSKIINNLYKIMNTEDYKSLLKEYKEFIINITNLFIKLNITNSIEVAILFNDLLFDGYLSKDRQFDIVDTTEYDLLVKTWGSRVCTGKSVCRHNASLLIDIERNLGNYCEYVDITCIHKRNIIKQKMIDHKKKLIVNHLVAGFQYEDEIFLYDPNNYYFLFRKDTKSNDVIDFIGIDKFLKYQDCFISYFSIINNDNQLDLTKILPYYKIDGDFIMEISSKILEIYAKNESLINNFYFDNSKRIRKLAYLNSKIILGQKLYK